MLYAEELVAALRKIEGGLEKPSYDDRYVAKRVNRLVEESERVVLPNEAAELVGRIDEAVKEFGENPALEAARKKARAIASGQIAEGLQVWRMVDGKTFLVTKA